MPKTVKAVSHFIAIASTYGLATFALSQPTFAQDSNNLELRELVNRGNQLMVRRQFAAAQAEYEAAKKLEPSNQIVKHNLAELFNNWGINYFQQKSYAEAIAQFQKCLAILPGHGNAKYNIQLCRRAMQNQGMNPDELPDAAADGKEDKEKPKSEQAKGSDDKKDSATAAAPAGDSMSVSSGNKTIFKNNVPFVSGSSVFPVYSDKSGAAKTTVNVVNPAAMTIPGGPTITSSGVAVGSAPATATSIQDPTSGSVDSTGSAKPKYNPIAPKSSQPLYVPMPATYDETPQDSQASQSSMTPPSNHNSAQSIQTPQTPAFNRAATETTMTLDEKVTALELKVYGKKHVDLPIMRRIDQLETDYIGQIRSGSMSDRVDYLKKAIGQN